MLVLGHGPHLEHVALGQILHVCQLAQDINTQQSFEQLNPRAVGVVVDPIQSVKGKVVIDCFRLINHQMLMLGQEKML